jgi:hypothetical protein
MAVHCICCSIVFEISFEIAAIRFRCPGGNLEYRPRKFRSEARQLAKGWDCRGFPRLAARLVAARAGSLIVAPSARDTEMAPAGPVAERSTLCDLVAALQSLRERSRNRTRPRGTSEPTEVRDELAGAAYTRP